MSIGYEHEYSSHWWSSRPGHRWLPTTWWAHRRGRRSLSDSLSKTIPARSLPPHSVASACRTSALMDPSTRHSWTGLQRRWVPPVSTALVRLTPLMVTLSLPSRRVGRREARCRPTITLGRLSVQLATAVPPVVRWPRRSCGSPRSSQLATDS